MSEAELKRLSLGYGHGMPMPYWQQRAVQEYLGKRFRGVWKNRNFINNYSMGFQRLKDGLQRTGFTSTLAAVNMQAFSEAAQRMQRQIEEGLEKLRQAGFTVTSTFPDEVDLRAPEGMSAEEQSRLYKDAFSG